MEAIEPKRIKDATYVCTIPAELGAVLKLEERRGRIVAVCEHGKMITPTYRPLTPQTPPRLPHLFLRQDKGIER